MDVIIPHSFRLGSQTPFADLVGDARSMHRVGKMFELELRKSFDVDEKRMGKAFRERVQTQSEIRRRGEILARWFQIFRGELGYSLSRCEDELGKALRSDLDGELYMPPESTGTYGVPEGDRR